MKKMVAFMVLLAIMAEVFGQHAGKSSLDKDFYLSISKKQNTTGWVLLLSGTAMAVGGALAFDSSWEEGSATSTDIFGIIMMTGVIADLASIPFFISAGVNKRRAASLSFQFRNLPHALNYARNSFPGGSINLCIHL